jgi:excisionase family DNA binding protein
VEDVLNAKQAAKILGYTARHVIRLVESGEIEGRKLGREWILSKQSVLAYKERKKKRE